jgi:hypothetical protein
MPLLPPVTKATLPANLSHTLSSIRRQDHAGIAIINDDHHIYQNIYDDHHV